LEHAVYAIINEYATAPAEGKRAGWPDYIVEVEGERWLARAEPVAGLMARLYDQIPASVTSFQSLAVEELPEPFGTIRQIDEPDNHYFVEIGENQLKHAGLVVLALIFLLDRSARG
jgi:hypothetical protein